LIYKGKKHTKPLHKAKVLSGKRFSGNVSEEELKKWADEWL
jgi:hypothetical protein